MTDFQFTHEDILEFTRGGVNQKALANWTNAQQWVTELAPVERGKARRYSRVNLIEVAIVRQLMRFGLSRVVAMLAIKARARGALSAKRSSGFVTHADLAAAFSDVIDLAPGKSEKWWWLINISVSDIEGEEIPNQVITEPVEEKRLGAALAANKAILSTASFLAVPIGGVVAEVDEFIALRSAD